MVLNWINTHTKSNQMQCMVLEWFGGKQLLRQLGKYGYRLNVYW